jgi:choline dehydrogenase-like flavoprotein
MIRLAVRFDEAVSDPAVGVPVHQVEEFKPHLTLGCSHTSLAHVALWLAGDIENKQELLSRWDHMAVYYALCTSTARGTVRNLPLFNEPLVRFALNDRDMKLLGEGLYRLGQLAFAAGAVEVFNPIEGGASLRSPSDFEVFRRGVPHGKVNLTSIHLFSSCPMGEDTGRCAVDSFGRHHAMDNLFINDASILPACPGVNPQATIMAIARRNAVQFLRSL